MPTLYIVRHAQSQANAQNLLAGQENFPLTEQGQEDALAIAIAYDKARAEEKAAASEKERLGNLIRGMLGENKKGLLAGWSITLPRIEKSSFDSKAFAEAHPDLYAQFVRTSAYKQLKVQLLKGKKK